MIKKGQRVTLAPDFQRGPEDWGRDEVIEGTAIGCEYATEGGMSWTAVHWDDEEDPNWCKTDGLVKILTRKGKA